MSVFFAPLNGLLMVVALAIYWGLLRRWHTRRLLLLLFATAVLVPIAPITFALALVGAWILAVTGRGHGRARRLAGLVGGFVVVLLLGKYGLAELAWVLGADSWLLAPLGISYLVFRLIQVAIDHHRRLIEEPSFVDLATFLVFPATFPAGPLETYQGFHAKRSDGFDRSLFARGLQRIVIGFAKKVLVVDLVLRDHLGEMMQGWDLGLGPVDAASATAAWSRVFLTFLYAYLDLSALTDLAVGCSALFGIRVMENFKRPLWQPNISAFWRSWHISLSSWCRNNVYFPVFGATRRVAPSLYACMLVMGLWHDLTLGWTCWGLWHASGMLVYARWERLRKRSRRLKRVARWPGYGLLAHLATLAFVTLGYAFVGARDVQDALVTFWHCLGWPLA